MKDTDSITGGTIEGEPFKNALMMGFSVIPAITVIVGILISAMWLALLTLARIFDGMSWILDNMP